MIPDTNGLLIKAGSRPDPAERQRQDRADNRAAGDDQQHGRRHDVARGQPT